MSCCAMAAAPVSMKSIFGPTFCSSFPAICRSILMLDGTRNVANLGKGSSKTEKKALRSFRLSIIYNVAPDINVVYTFERLPRWLSGPQTMKSRSAVKPSRSMRFSALAVHASSVIITPFDVPVEPVVNRISEHLQFDDVQFTISFSLKLLGTATPPHRWTAR